MHDRTAAVERLKLRRDSDTLDVAEAAWREAVARAEADPAVGIRHAAIAGDPLYRVYVAAIPLQVGCHFHTRGDEDYAVVEGEGVLHWGAVAGYGREFRVHWEPPVPVRAGDRFVIPEGYAHQLRKTGDRDLVILFGCPDAHVDDRADRTLLEDAPD